MPRLVVDGTLRRVAGGPDSRAAQAASIDDAAAFFRFVAERAGLPARATADSLLEDYTLMLGAETAEQSEASPGLNRTELSALETVTVADGTECPVCFTAFSTGRLLPCSHAFCEACTARWMDSNTTCPMCRLDCRFVNGFAPFKPKRRTPLVRLAPSATEHDGATTTTTAITISGTSSTTPALPTLSAAAAPSPPLTTPTEPTIASPPQPASPQPCRGINAPRQGGARLPNSARIPGSSRSPSLPPVVGPHSPTLSLTTPPSPLPPQMRIALSPRSPASPARSPASPMSVLHSPHPSSSSRVVSGGGQLRAVSARWPPPASALPSPPQPSPLYNQFGSSPPLLVRAVGPAPSSPRSLQLEARLAARTEAPRLSPRHRASLSPRHGASRGRSGRHTPLSPTHPLLGQQHRGPVRR